MSEKKWLRLIERGRGDEAVPPCDGELKALLAAWDAPHAPAAMDEKIFAAYRANFRRAPLWKRLCAAQIRLPVPVAAALALLVGALGWLSFGQSSMPGSPPAPLIETKVVEVPVVHEKVVTRTVYVTRPAAAPAVTLAASRAATAPPRAAAVQPAQPVSLSSQVAGDSAYTSVDLSGFQPVDEIKVTVIKGKNHDEK
jgi:hypothetical protein